MLIKQKIEHFCKREGRRPRILVSNMGNKNHDHDTKLLASLFAESGFDVDISPRNQTPRGTARMAIENDVHVICFLSIENKHRSLITELKKELKAEQAENIRIIMGGTIPQSDYKFLYAAGVNLILGSVVADKTTTIKRLLDLFD